MFFPKDSQLTGLNVELNVRGYHPAVELDSNQFASIKKIKIKG